MENFIVIRAQEDYQQRSIVLLYDEYFEAVIDSRLVAEGLYKKPGCSRESDGFFTDGYLNV